MSEYTMTINGKAAKTEAGFEVINPATGAPFTTVPDATEAQVNEAVQAAKMAFKTWSKDEHARREALGKLPQLIEENLDEIAKLLTLEQGKPLAKAISEVKTSIAFIRNCLEKQLPVEALHAKEDQRTSYVSSKPLGVVAGIGPWNYPVHDAILKILPVLLTGNTIVFKPAPTTPVTALFLGELFRKVLPPGVCNIITGKDKATVGKLLVAHPDVAKIDFTGSIATGKAIALEAAKTLKRVTLELGGNDAAIVLGDTNIDEQAQAIFWGAFANCGQICVATKRLYVHESIYESLVKKLVNLANSVKVGDGFDEDVQIGPINNRAQFERVKELVADAKAQGAKIEVGGEPMDRAGYFFKPTIVTGIKEGVRLVDEEQFGPVLPVMSFKTESEAIERANNTRFGLGASVWSANTKKAQEIAEQLEAGTVWVNHIHGAHPDAPFGGFKDSGIGRVNGKWGLQEMTEIQSICVPDA